MRIYLYQSLFSFGLRRDSMASWARQFARVLVIAGVLVSVSADNSVAVNTGCIGGNCVDVPTDGISYTSGVGIVNVGDGVPGITTVNPGKTGIELSRIGVFGANSATVDFQTILWDTDGDTSTTLVRVVSADGTSPLMASGQYILVSGASPPNYTVGSNTYNGEQLVQVLATSIVDTGATISGSLTVNNEASFNTADAKGISVNSRGGNGGNGGCWSILLATWCDDGARGGDAGSLVVNNNALFVVGSTVDGMHGISAISRGGDGGKGGGWFGLFASVAGAGGNGGNGGDVYVMLGTGSDITTEGPKSHGVFAQSRGGDGGAAGSSAGALAFGDTGGNGGNAGSVTVDNDGTILTTGWNSHGIYAQSVGAGAGSGSSSDGIYAEGGNGGGQSSGGTATVNNSGSITTKNSDSYGILVQSIGGGGGDGGGAGGWFTVGGRGGSGGGSDVVTVYDSGKVGTAGDRSTAIFAQSIGGGGGNGGDAVSVSSTISVAVGGSGGPGGNGNEVRVIADGSDINTSGDQAHGIHAQSVGGGGGNGGLAVSGTLPGNSPINVSVALGGTGGDGGYAGDLVSVQTSSGTTINTTGNSSYGIIAQSIGGGGGNGAIALSGAGGPGLSVAVSIGGSGGVAQAGKDVVVVNAGTITTSGDLSTGIFTQSIGGGGGNGGFAGSLAIGGGAASVSLGGSGGTGGLAGQINVDNTGTIGTGGDSAAGIFAQSIGGGGGNGGSALSGSFGLASVSTTIGGAGGEGNNGGLVDVLNSGLITTLGNNSAGIFAQSIGGGGGSGGDATSLAFAGPVAVAVAVGGSGGSGGIGGEAVLGNDGQITIVGVIVGNDGRIMTQGPNSDGIFAQSVGGSGGSGGSATSGTLVFPVEINGVEIPAISANVSVGGRGAGGGTAGTVTVANTGEIVTTDFFSNGIFAQSVGGSGGRGGHATNISIAFDAMFTGKVSVGGSGGQGGTGNTVTVGNSGLLHTQGDFSSGVFAQSVGGGGGAGGNATNVSLSLTPPPTSPADFIPTPSANFDLAIGGNGGSGATGGNVKVTSTGTISTEGKFAVGVMAQSVGGGGGSGGDARTIQVELTADPMDFLPLTSLTSLDMTLVFGGTGGTGSHGGAVLVSNVGDVVTTGAFSHGIVAQSVGGGGGSGGSAMTFEFSNADVVPDIPVLDTISGLTTIEMTLQGSGGAGGDGGNVTVNSIGNIRTVGDFAIGIVAQSVAGGGGLAGFFNPQGITNNKLADSLISTFVDTEAGLSFAGSVGGAGTAGEVIVHHTGDIVTQGDGAHGILAQSAAGQGAGGKVTVTLDGGVWANAKDADGILAQSVGLGGADDIAINVNGSVQGGSGGGAGVRLLNGADNTLTNRGTIMTVSGIAGNAIIGTTGNDAISNFGTVTGNVDLGAGINSLNNQIAARFNPGTILNLGTGNTLTNAGTLSPGGTGTIQATTLTGNLVQISAATLALDLDSANGLADRLNVSGTSDLAGLVAIRLINTGFAFPGTRQHTIIASANGVTNAGLDLIVKKSAVTDYKLLFPNSTEVVLATTIDFRPTGLTGAQRAVGDYINRIQLAGGSTSMAPLVNEILNLSESHDLASAYEHLSPDSYAGNTTTSYNTTTQYLNAVNSRMQNIRSNGMISGNALRSDIQLDKALLLAYNGSDASIAELFDTGQDKQVPKRYGVWIDGFGKWGDQDGNSGYTGFNYQVAGGAIGLDFLVGDRAIIGVSGGSSYTDINLDDRKGSGSINSTFASLYGSYFTKQFYLDTSLAYSRQNFRNNRNVVVGSLQSTAHSKHNGDVYAASVEGGYNFNINKLLLQPFVALHYIHLAEDGFRETGSGSVNLLVNDRSANSLTSELGLRIAQVFQTGYGNLIPELRVAWKHDYDIDNQVISATFEGSPNQSFVVEGQELDRDGVGVSTGMTFILKNGFSTNLKYDAELREDYSSHGLFGELRYSF